MIAKLKALVGSRRRRLALLVLLGACFVSWSALSLLWDRVDFYFHSSSLESELVDVRKREEGDWWRLLNSGSFVWQGSALYYPIVSYRCEGFVVPLRVELPEPQTMPYERGAMIPLRVLDAAPLEARQSGGFFMWGGALLRSVLACLMFLIARLLWHALPAPVPVEVPAPKKQPAKKRAAKPKAARKPKATK